MKIKISFLGSGSRGNCTLVETVKGNFLIDAGFGIKRTNPSLHELEIKMEEISGVILTHTHDDHVKDSMLTRMSISNIPLHCRKEHQLKLSRYCGFGKLVEKGLVKFYGDKPFELIDNVTVDPIALSHDSPATHGFIFNIKNFRFSYISDCGFTSIPSLTKKLKHSDLIALEFNHDEKMERQSGRHPFLIQRVLGPQGHLSNENAASLLNSVASENLQAVVQLHLSQDCNRPKLAMQSGVNAVKNIPIYQTSQDKTLRWPEDNFLL